MIFSCIGWFFGCLFSKILCNFVSMINIRSRMSLFFFSLKWTTVFFFTFVGVFAYWTFCFLDFYLIMVNFHASDLFAFQNITHTKKIVQLEQLSTTWRNKNSLNLKKSRCSFIIYSFIEFVLLIVLRILLIFFFSFGWYFSIYIILTLDYCRHDDGYQSKNAQ